MGSSYLSSKTYTYNQKSPRVQLSTSQLLAEGGRGQHCHLTIFRYTQFALSPTDLSSSAMEFYKNFYTYFSGADVKKTDEEGLTALSL